MDEQQRKALLKETFDSVSEGYDNGALRFFPASARNMAASLGLRGDEHVLDVACGTGHASFAIANEGGCRQLFDKAGLTDIRIEQKNAGYYLDSAEQWWDVVWNAGYRRMMSQLSPGDRARFKQEHLAEIAALGTDKGVWLDVGVLYTVGTKPEGHV